MEADSKEQRRHERVKIPYVLKFCRREAGAPTNWDAVKPINVSESGICFLTTDRFTSGTEMHLLVTNPMLAEERVYDCKVLRSGKPQDHSRFYETVVTIENMDDDARRAYLKMLESFSVGGDR